MPFLWSSSGKFSSEKMINQKWGKEIKICQIFYLFIYLAVCSQKYERMIIEFWIYFIFISKFMARFWLNLGWLGWLPFCPPLATDESPLWLELQNTKKIPEENTDWYPTQPACKLQQQQCQSCVYLGTWVPTLYIVFSLLLLCKTYNWLGTCHFSWCCNNYACNANAMQCSTE